jgi:hypothetical protein
MEFNTRFNTESDLTTRLIDYLKSIEEIDDIEVKPDGNLYTKDKE